MKVILGKQEEHHTRREIPIRGGRRRPRSMIEDERSDSGTRDDVVKHTKSTPGSRRQSVVQSKNSERDDHYDDQAESPRLYRTKSGPPLSHTPPVLVKGVAQIRIPQDSELIPRSSRARKSAQEDDEDYIHRDLEFQYAQQELALMKRERNELVATNRNLLDELTEYRRDTDTRCQVPDTEVEKQYKNLVSMVEQAARKICELKDYQVGFVQRYLDRHLKPGRNREVYTQDNESYNRLTTSLRENQTDKRMQRWTVEMLLFRRLEHSVLPPKTLDAGMSWSENKAAAALLIFMVNRILQEESHETVRLAPLERWRLDTMNILNDHSKSNSSDLDSLRHELLSTICDDFDIDIRDSHLLQSVSNTALDFARCLQAQRSIYLCRDVVGRFDQEYMDFQDSRQDELRVDHPGVQLEVFLGISPALVKLIPVQPFMSCISKGKALFKPVGPESP